MAGWVDFLIYPLGVLLVLAMARAAVQTYNKRSVEREDSRSTYQRLYGKAANPRTGEPATKGWTDQVDEQLEVLTAGQKEQKTLLNNLHQTVTTIGEHILENQATVKEALEKNGD